jgi:lactoylglutathione lyase family protein
MIVVIYPRGFNHVGLSVPDIESAVKFYTTCFGAYLIMPPTKLSEDGSPISEICTDIFGPGWDHCFVAHLSTIDSIGIEMFSFPKSHRPAKNFDYERNGIFHFCFTDPDIEGCVARIVELGGKQRSKIWQIFPDKPGRMVYCEDPFGTILEVYTHRYETSWVRT